MGRGTAVDVPARRAPCVLGARHAAVSTGVGARRSTKDSRKGSLSIFDCRFSFLNPLLKTL